MFYSICIHLDEYDETILQMNQGKNIIKYEIVFGLSPFFDILFFLSTKSTMDLKKIQKKYERTFFLHSRAQQFYDSIMNHIAISKRCEIV